MLIYLRDYVNIAIIFLERKKKDRRSKLSAVSHDPLKSSASSDAKTAEVS
jgi:hypothetical protein